MGNSSIELEIESRWSEWFLLCDNTTDIAAAIEKAVGVDIHDEMKVVLTVLYAKILKSFFSALILIKAGYGQDAGAVTRVLVETLFVLQASYLDEKFYKQYKDSAERVRIQALTGAKRHAKRHAMPLEYINEIQEGLCVARREIDENNIGRYSVEVAAKTANLMDMYDLTYRNLCAKCSHPSPWCLEEHLEKDTLSGEVYILFGPSVTDVEFIFFSLAQSVLIASITMSKVLALQLEPEIGLVYQRVIDLGKTIWK